MPTNRVSLMARRGRRMPRLLTAAAAVGLLGSSVSIAIVAVSSLPASAAPAVSLYVTTTGSGSVCSQASPCGSIQTAINTAQGGSYNGDDVTINVATGTYTENDNISASPLNSLTIAGAGASTTTVNGNHAGSVFTVNNGTVTFSGLTITNGNGVDGGGIANQGNGTVNVSNSTLSGNSGSNGGGGIANDGTGTVNVSNSTLTGNSSPSGGAIADESTGTVNVTNSILSGNGHAVFGGGIWEDIISTVTVSNSTLTGNTADNAAGIYSPGTLIVSNSTLTGNTADVNGGGIFINGNPGSTATVSNSTLTGNTAAGVGGGIVNLGALALTDSTLVGNSAGGSGGGIENGGTANLGASIVAENPTGGGCSGTVTDEGYNIADDATCGFSATGSVNSSATLDASLGALANNGGPTQTILPILTSPAVRVIPTGTTLNSVSVCPRTDPRGVASVGNCTIGAVEVPPLAPLAPADPPVIGAVSAGNMSVTVSFTPGSPGSGPILSFGVVCKSSDGGFDGAATGAASPIVVSGLTNGKTYACTVFAQNAFGISGLSGPSNPFVPSAAGTVPTAPTVTAVTAGNGSASVTFDPPTSNGSNPVANYTVSCVSSDGGTASAGSGPNDPTSTAQSVSVSGLSNGHTYTCTVAATNVNGTGPASGASASFVPAATTSCSDMQTCTGLTVTRTSPSSPAQTVRVAGIPAAAIGSVTVSSAPAVLRCPGVAPAITSVTTLTDTGFPTTSSLKATVRQFAVATGPAKVCYHSTTPFKSVSHPTTPKAGTFILLACSAVANVAPCEVSSSQTSTPLDVTSPTATTLNVTFLAAGGDPNFSIVVPTGRLVWPSTFPTGKVGTAYGSHFQSRGGKAPFQWKVHSGKLAPGLTLNTTTGAVTGTPTTKGTFSCVVHASDAESPPKTADISVTITIT